MRHSIQRGIGFGLNSAVITILGVIVGVHAGTNLKHAIIGAVLVVAVADSLSDSLGVLLTEKSVPGNTLMDAVVSALCTFFTKIWLAFTFLLPLILIKDLHAAIFVCLGYGIAVLGIYSFVVARRKKENPVKDIFVHILLAIVVITLSHILGAWAQIKFGGAGA